MSPTRPEVRPLRLALVLGQLDRGGSEGQAVELARGLAERGHQVRFFSFRDGPRRGEIDLPCHVPTFPFAGRGFSACLTWLRAFQPDVAYTFGARAHSWGRLAARLAGVPRLLVGYRQQRDYWLDRFTLRWNAAVVCNARAIAERVARRYRLPPEMLQVIPNGVDVDRFTAAEAGDLASLGIRRPFIVQTARLHPNKDHETALRAFQQLHQAQPDVQLVLVGDGPCRPTLERLARTLGVGPQVRFLGDRAEVAPILAGAAVGWLSSRIEGSPNAVLEYLATGLPVVATRAGGTAELLRDGRDGFLCEIGDAGALAQRTLELLADRALRARLGAEGRDRAAREFPLETMIERTETLLRQVEAKPAPRGPVVVVLNEFPKRSETFVFRELVAWRERGLDVRPFSLLPASRQLPDEMAPWREDTVYLHRQLSPALVFDLLRGAAAGLVSPLATWRRARGSGRLRNAFGGWLAAAALTRLGRRLAVRRLHAAWGNAPAEAALRAARRLGVPYTVSVHAVDLWCDTAPGAPRLTEAEALYACNREAAAALIRANPALEPRLRLLPHSLPPLDRFPLVDRVAGPPWRLLAVGRLVPKKGFDRLVGLCRRLRERGHDVECRIIGEGPLARRLERQISRSGLGDRLRLVGPTDLAGVAHAMSESHTLVAPSRVASDGDREGLPNVLLEALLTGLPVVATRTGSVEEVLENGATGRLVPVDDDDALEGAIVETIADYPRALEWARAGREAVLARRAAEDQATALARVFAS